MNDEPKVELEFVARVSHELRSPLHSVLGLSELIVAESPEGEVARLATVIRREAESMKVMIDDILDFARLSSDRPDLNAESFSPSRLIADIAEGNRPGANRKALSLLLSVDPQVPLWVRGDAVRYAQVVRNLVTNAIRYTDSGTIVIRLVTNQQAAIICEVQDSGVGIPQGALDQLFEPFFQAHLDRPGGTGLGLAVSHRLAEAMGGDLTVESEVNVGSTFRFSVKLESADPVVDRPAAAGQTEQRSGRILVVDDSRVNRMLATSQLEILGLDAVTVESGEAAVELLHDDDDFAVVLMDWNLPGMDGLDTTRAIRRQPSINPEIPIIAMTANALTGDRERCLTAGMNDFLAKPVGLDDLRDMLDRWMKGTPDLADQPAPRHNRSVETDVLDALATELGDEAIVNTLITTFLEELPSRREEIVAGSASGDIHMARRAAHTLKSTGSLLGATTLASLCSRLDVIDTDDPTLPTLIEQLDHEITDVTQVFNIRLLAKESAS